ncbi:MAG TPA: DUF3352 domain-containing protein [Ktedonobacterales bacterium]
MSTDDSEQPGDLAPSHDSTTHEPGEQTPLPLESAPILTDTDGAPATTTPETPSPAPHMTPAVDVALPGPALQEEQPSEEPPTLVYMGASQATPTQPPSTVIAPSAPNTPTPPPLPEVIAGQPPTQQRRGRIRSLLVVISAICIVALLASGSYLLFNLLSSHTEGDVAHIVPSSTVALVSVDLVAAAAHGQRITLGDLGNATGQSGTVQLLTGLDWDKDILPWVGRDMALAIFQRQPPYRSPNGSQGTSATNVNDTIGAALLLQSRDDAAAQAAIRKAANYQQSQGFTLVSLDYHGLTLYHTSLLQGDESGTTLAAGKGWAIIAGDLPAARVLVDRLTGNSSATDTLAATSAYHDAVGSLPANRFGTLFLNTRALVKGFVYGGSSQTEMASALANTYPVAVGYLMWTSDGLRAQLTFPSARNLAVGSLSGDTTTLANLTPADAFAYVGVANVGAMLHAQNTLTVEGTPATGTATSFFGLVPTDPALQQPAAISLIGEPQGATGYLALLNAPDRADALAMVGQAAEQQHWTSKTTTVDGRSVTAYYAKLPPAQTTANVTTDAETTNAATTPPMQLVGMDTWLDNILIFASDTTVMADAIHTIRDHAPNLATNTRFQQLVREAPGGAYATTFLDLSRAATSGDAVTSVMAAGLAARIPALLVTHVWNDNHYQATADLLLPK